MIGWKSGPSFLANCVVDAKPIHEFFFDTRTKKQLCCWLLVITTKEVHLARISASEITPRWLDWIYTRCWYKNSMVRWIDLVVIPFVLEVSPDSFVYRVVCWLLSSILCVMGLPKLFYYPWWPVAFARSRWRILEPLDAVPLSQAAMKSDSNWVRTSDCFTLSNIHPLEKYWFFSLVVFLLFL